MIADPGIPRYEQIAEECFALMGINNAFLESPDGWDFSALDDRLRELLRTRHQFHEGELACYLRFTFQRNDQLPTWQPLLNAAIELVRQRGRYNVENTFYGLLPEAAPTINRNTGQPKQ